MPSGWCSRRWSGSPRRRRGSTSTSHPVAARFRWFSFTGRYRGEWARHDLALLETALAVRLYRVTRGRYPPSLAPVDRAWLPGVPNDAWDQPVRYRLAQGRPVVYSIGPDGLDEKGLAVEPSGLVGGDAGDVVFGKLSSAYWDRVKTVATKR